MKTVQLSAIKQHKNPSLSEDDKKEKKKKKKKLKMPPSGPQITILHMAENGINHLGRGGNFAPVRCMQLMKA